MQYDSNRPMIGMQFDQRQELIIERIADHSLEVLEHPHAILPEREERKHEINEEEKLMDEICKEQEESSENPVPVLNAPPQRSSFMLVN